MTGAASAHAPSVKAPTKLLRYIPNFNHARHVLNARRDRAAEEPLRVLRPGPMPTLNGARSRRQMALSDVPLTCGVKPGRRSGVTTPPRASPP